MSDKYRHWLFEALAMFFITLAVVGMAHIVVMIWLILLFKLMGIK